MIFIFSSSDFSLFYFPEHEINCFIRQFDYSFCEQEVGLISGLWSKTRSGMYIGSAGTLLFSQFSCQLIRNILSKLNCFQIDSWVRKETAPVPVNSKVTASAGAVTGPKLV